MKTCKQLLNYRMNLIYLNSERIPLPLKGWG